MFYKIIFSRSVSFDVRLRSTAYITRYVLCFLSYTIRAGDGQTWTASGCACRCGVTWGCCAVFFCVCVLCVLCVLFVGGRLLLWLWL